MKKIVTTAAVLIASYGCSFAQERLYVSNGGNVYIGNSAELTLGTGALVAADTLVCTGNLNVRGGQLSGYYHLRRLVIDGGGTVTLDSTGTDTTEVMISEGVQVTGGSTLAANGQLRLLSVNKGAGEDSTARIEELTTGNSVTGTVTIERYIPGGKRRYRFFSHPFTTTQSFANTLLDDIDVTGAGGSANGFTNTFTNSPSAWWFDATLGDTAIVGPNPGWQAFASANANNWDRYKGIYLMIRGSKGQGLVGATYTPQPVTIDMSGPINQGSQTISVSSGVNGGGFNIVGNPYPSAVNLKTPIANTANKKGSGFWLMNTNMGSTGAYEVYLFNTDCMLPSNSAFAIDVTANTSITFQENYKTDTGRAVFKGTGVQDMIEFQVHSDSIYWDKMYVMFDPGADAKFDNADARKFTNADANFYALTDDNMQVSINGLPFKDGKIIPVNFDTKIVDTYEIRVKEYIMQSGYEVYLTDKYLNVTTKLNATSAYRFAVTSDSLSAGNRFQLGLSELPSGLANMSANSKLKLYPNPAQDVITVELGAAATKNTIMNVLNATGRVVISQPVGEGINSIDVALNNLVPGVYHIKIQGAETLDVARFVKINR